VGGALLLLGPDADGAYTPAAVWPDATRDLQYLTPAAQRVLAERRGIVVASDGVSAPIRDQAAHVGYPTKVSGTLHGVVALDMAPGPEIGLQRALRLLHWASIWLVDEFRKRALQEREHRLDQVSLSMDLVATAAQERRFAASALTGCYSSAEVHVPSRLSSRAATVSYSVASSFSASMVSWSVRPRASCR
jgi:hypothetical protein